MFKNYLEDQWTGHLTYQKAAMLLRHREYQEMAYLFLMRQNAMSIALAQLLADPNCLPNINLGIYPTGRIYVYAG